MKKIIAVNASPRRAWNTSRLIREAAEGAKSAGAEAEVVDLYTIGKYTGCISCFGCKNGKNFGRCVCRDDLLPLLDKIRDADGLIIGTPNYLGDASSGFRALYERLIFQYITYNGERFSSNLRRIPVLFIMTSNAPDSAYREEGFYFGLIDNYRRNFERFIGPTDTLFAGDTLQVDDYSRYDWTIFDPKAKKARHESVFPEKLAQARKAGERIVTGGD